MDFVARTSSACAWIATGPVQGPDLFLLGQFLCLAFAQLTYGEPPDIQACLRVASQALPHGFRSTVARNTLAHANEVRDCGSTPTLPGADRDGAGLYATEPFGSNSSRRSTPGCDCHRPLPGPVPLGHLPQAQRAVKLHTLLDLRGNIRPCYSSRPARARCQHSRHPVVEAGAIYVFDRATSTSPAWPACTRLSLLCDPRQAELPVPVPRLASRRPHHRGRFRSDHSALRLLQQASYPDRLRRIRYFDAERRTWLVFLTNNFTLPL